jgi:hypothetical protein
MVKSKREQYGKNVSLRRHGIYHASMQAFSLFGDILSVQNVPYGMLHRGQQKKKKGH